MYSFLLYLLVLIIVIWAMDGVNINAIFKKNRVYQAKVFYIIIIFSLASMTTNFILSFLNSLK